MYYLQQCYFTKSSYEKATNRNFIKQGNFFYRACLFFNEEKFVNIIIYSTLAGVFFSAIFGVKGDYYTFVPLSKGFCTSR